MGIFLISDLSFANVKSRISETLANSNLTFKSGRNQVGPVNCAVIGDSREEILSGLQIALSQMERGDASGEETKGVFFQRNPFGSSSLAFLFPGQGSQHVQMLMTLRNRFAHFNETALEYDRIWQHLTGSSLLEIIDDDSRDDALKRLSDTRMAQPSIGLLSAALAATFVGKNVVPAYVVGHSYGELPALWHGGAFDTRTLFVLSKKRGELMAKADELAPGAMLAVIDEKKTAQKLLTGISDVAVLASHNAPRQFVVSGKKQAIDEVMERAAKEGVKVRRLNTSAAFHSPLMEAVTGKWSEELVKASIAVPAENRVQSTVSGHFYSRGVEEVRDLLHKQFCHPVLWVESIENLYAKGARIFLEVGPNSILSGLTRQTLGEKQFLTLTSDPGKHNPSQHLERLVASLAGHGIVPDWNYVDLESLPAGAGVQIDSRRGEAGLPPIELDDAMGQGEPRPRPTCTPSNNNDNVLIGTSFFETNRSVVEAFFDEQQVLADHCLPLDNASRKQVLEELLQSNQLIIRKFLEAQTVGARALLSPLNQVGTVTVGGVEPDSTVVLPQVPVVQVAPPAENKSLNTEPKAELEQWLCKAIADVTGFLPDTITLKSDLSADLGLDSITTLEVYFKLVKAFPHLEGLGELVRNCRTVGDVVSVLVQKDRPNSSMSQNEEAAQPRALETAKKESSRELRSVNRSALEECLISITAVEASVPKGQVSLTASLGEDLGLDLFIQGEIIEQYLKEFPSLIVAGEHLRGLSTLEEIVDFSLSILQSELSPVGENNACASLSVVERFLPKRVSMEQSSGVLPQRVLLVSLELPSLANTFGECSEMFSSATKLVLCQDGWKLSSGDEPRIRLDDEETLTTWLKKEHQFGLEALVFVCPISEVRAAKDDEIDSWTRGVNLAGTGLFVLAKSIDNAGIRPQFCGILGSQQSSASYTAARGIARGLAHEWSDCRVRTVWLDHNSGEVSKEQALKTLCIGDGDRDVMLSAAGATTLSLVKSARPSPESSAIVLSPEAPVLLIGGGDGITAQMGIGLARRFQCPIVATGRTAFPSSVNVCTLDEVTMTRAIREKAERKYQGESPFIIAAHVQKELRRVRRMRAIQGTRERITSVGSEFHYFQADASNLEQMESVIADVHREIGPIQGVILGAGILEDALLKEKKLDSFRRVLETKSNSAFLSYKLLRNEPLKFAFLLSSIVSYTGNSGQVDYIAGNEIVNQIAHLWNEEVPYPVRALLWSVWSETGLAPSYLRSEIDLKGLGGIGNEDGVAAFLDELAFADADQAKVILSSFGVLRSLCKGMDNDSSEKAMVGR